MVLSLFLLGFAAPASAHIQLRFKTLFPSSGSGATEVWKINCSNTASGTANQLSVQIKDHIRDTNKLSVVVYKDDKAASTTDIVGEDGDYSPKATVAAGDGVYTLMVHHTRVGFGVYSLSYQCEDAEGNYLSGSTSVPSTPVQDQ